MQADWPWWANNVVPTVAFVQMHKCGYAGQWKSSASKLVYDVLSDDVRSFHALIARTASALIQCEKSSEFGEVLLGGQHVEQTGWVQSSLKRKEWA